MKRSTCYFLFGVCFLKTVSYRPKHARNVLISNLYGIIRILVMVIKIIIQIFNENKIHAHRNKMKNVGFLVKAVDF